MSRLLLKSIAIALIFLFVGVAGAAAVFEWVPDPGSAPSIFDDFNWNSTANGFWHVNDQGTHLDVSHSMLTLTGNSVELDHRVQTDPYATTIVAKVRGISFDKFGIGLGVYHAGTIGMEFDNDGVKCGRGTSDQGWQVDIMKPWTNPPVNQWYYLRMDVLNPYPTLTNTQLGKISTAQLKPVTIHCMVFNAARHLVAYDTPTNPAPNAHYVALDEALIHTWDSGNKYQVDWIYSGPLSGIPVKLTP